MYGSVCKLLMCRGQGTLGNTLTSSVHQLRLVVLEMYYQKPHPTALAESLKGVTGGLSTAFETTLLALLFALFLQLLVTFLHKSEEEFLDECSEYCQKNIVSKLRIMPFEQGAD